MAQNVEMRRSSAPSKACYFASSSAALWQANPPAEIGSSPPKKIPCLATSQPSQPRGGNVVRVENNNCIEIQNAASTTSKYYKVVYGKFTKKKHMTWDGDGVLCVVGRSATLFGEDGKEVLKSTGCKLSQLEGLEEGSELPLGGKKVEILQCISFLQFSEFLNTSASSANIWCTEAPEASTRMSLNSASVSREFKKVVVDKHADCSDNKEQRVAKKNLGGLHNTTSQSTAKLNAASDVEAFVLPKPPAMHIFSNNNEMLPVVDVVVDSWLARHLRPHQREGVRFLYECVMGFKREGCFGAILADAMGLGKTLQTITVAWTLLKQGPYGGRPVVNRILVVTPSSLVKNWECEFKKWLGSLRIRTFAATAENRIEEYLRAATQPVLIVSYEMFLRHTQRILQDISFGLVICDEAHRVKNFNLKLATSLQTVPTKRRILLTGTPLHNHLRELFALSEFCNPGLLARAAQRLAGEEPLSILELDQANAEGGNSLRWFRRVFESPILEGRQDSASEEVKSLGQERALALTRLTSSFVLRRTADVNANYLPLKTEYVVFCQPSELQLALFRCLLEVPRRQLLGLAEDKDEMETPTFLKNKRKKKPATSTSFREPLAAIDWCKKLCNDPNLLWHKLQTHHSRLEALGDNRVVDSDEDEEERYEDDLTDKPTKSLFSLSDVQRLLRTFPSNYSSPSEQGKEGNMGGKLWVTGRMLGAMLEANSQDKVVLVSHYTQTLDVLQRLCDSLKLATLRIDGKVAASQRMDIVHRFNQTGTPPRVLLLSSKAGGVGLNLIGARFLILYDSDWNPALDQQAMARVWRDGQRHPVRIYRLLTTGTLEEKIFLRQISKTDLSDAFVDHQQYQAHGDTKSNSRALSFSVEEMLDLFTLHENTDCHVHDLLQCSQCEKEGNEYQDDDETFSGATDEKREAQCYGTNEEGQTESSNPAVSSSSASLAELASWPHAVGREQVTKECEDPFIVAALGQISCVFWTETKMQLKEASDVDA